MISPTAPFPSLPWRDPATGDILVVIETPRGSQSKYVFDRNFEVFRLKRILPRGFCFPVDFGFIPATCAEDGDPLDAVVIFDEPLQMGSLVCGKALGVFELEQTQSGKTIRNDRIVVLPTALGRDHKLLSLTDLPHGLLFQIEHFFIGYARQEGKQIVPVGRGDEDRALAIIAAAARHYRKKQ